jgi:hypothetical protein
MPSLVNKLLTKIIKVNIAPSNQEFKRGDPMKKTKPARWNLWTYLLGGGSGNSGASS